MARFIVQPHQVANSRLEFTLVYDTEENDAAYFEGKIPSDVQQILDSDGVCRFPMLTVTRKDAQHHQSNFGTPGFLQSERITS